MNVEGADSFESSACSPAAKALAHILQGLAATEGRSRKKERGEFRRGLPADGFPLRKKKAPMRGALLPAFRSEGCGLEPHGDGRGPPRRVQHSFGNVQAPGVWPLPFFIVNAGCGAQGLIAERTAEHIRTKKVLFHTELP